MRREVVLFLSFLLFICVVAGGDVMVLEIKSQAFRDGGFIPDEYTCKGKDVSPPLEWMGVPEETKGFALICDDPDAPMKTWVHWVLYDIPADKRGLPENVAKTNTLPDGSKQGVTDFGSVGYGGPAAPPGRAHRYFFKLYALGSGPALPPGLTRDELLEAIEGHVIAAAQIMGKFKR